MNQVKNVRTLLFLFSIVCATCAPSVACAAVQITEIMYDVVGTDTGREWVEVTNTGSTPEDISTYKFFEDNTNHSISVSSGSGMLAAGASAVIVEDQAKFSADWPSYAGTLLKSSFSLSNAGETIGIKDSTLTLVDSVSYDSTMGAAGDGNSLQRTGSNFAAGVADPGKYAGAPSSSASPVHTSPAATSAQTQQVTAWTSSGPATLSVDIDAESYVPVGGGSFFTGSAHDDNGPKAHARYVWNFGDGTTAEGQTVFHAFTYPGTYVVQLSAGWGIQAGIGRTTVEAAPPQIGLIVEPDGSIAILNQASSELNIGLWNITSGTTTFVIPENTILLAHGSIRFAPSVMHMHAGQDAVVRYPNQTLVASAIPTHAEPAQNFFVGAGAPRQSSASLGRSSATGEAASAKSVLTPTSSVPVVSVAAAISSGIQLPLWSYVLGAIGLALVALAGASYMGFLPSRVTNTAADEFEVE